MPRRRLTSFLLLACLLSASPNPLHGQDQANSPDALKKQLADANNQLKAAQDRKNELATENEQLKAQLASMQKQMEELQRESAGWADRTYAMRAREAAWNAMLAGDVNLKARWEVLMESASYAELPRDIRGWKLSPAPATAPTTMPSSAPTTQK